MREQDRKKLQELLFSAEVIARTEEVLRIWEMEEKELFVKCSYCGKLCYNPDLPKRKHRRKKLPSELFWNEDLLGFKDSEGAVICWPCDEAEFQ